MPVVFAHTTYAVRSVTKLTWHVLGETTFIKINEGSVGMLMLGYPGLKSFSSLGLRM
jgi:hypothetical protein